jgi:hypothetical protein
MPQTGADLKHRTDSPAWSRQRRLWLALSTLWLQVIVVLFVIVGIARLRTPPSGWFRKLLALLSIN